MWVYNQSAGTISCGGKSFAGYSGNGRGPNNPAMQAVPNVGPCRQGLWDIAGPSYDSPTTGKYTLQLHPRRGTRTFGRSEFRMHGDNAKLDHSAATAASSFRARGAGGDLGGR